MLKLLQLKMHINIYFRGCCMQTYFSCIPVSFATAYKKWRVVYVECTFAYNCAAISNARCYNIHIILARFNTYFLLHVMLVKMSCNIICLHRMSVFFCSSKRMLKLLYLKIYINILEGFACKRILYSC